jgi:ABC-type microcin C transport system duplicated ATPase subunit YejF
MSLTKIQRNTYAQLFSQPKNNYNNYTNLSKPQNNPLRLTHDRESNVTAENIKKTLYHP